METIALPKNIEFKKDKDKNKAMVIVGPCFPGYGITLGNAVRRVLLSSLEGAAPIGVKIEEVDHEFMTLPHLKEDILEFILNLKQLKLKVFTENIEKLELEIHGKKQITAGDIKKNSNVEIMNEDLVLGNITDMSGKLKAEIMVSKGMGYETIESREADAGEKDKKEKQIGFIEMDSIFSPVLKAGIKVENIRVGKMTNWDNLIIDLETDGTVSPEQAFDESVEILINQFSALKGGREKERKEEDEAIQAEIKEEEEEGEEGDEEGEGEEEGKKDKEDKGGKKNDEEEKDEPKKKRGRPKKTE